MDLGRVLCDRGPFHRVMYWYVRVKGWGFERMCGILESGRICRAIA